MKISSISQAGSLAIFALFMTGSINSGAQSIVGKWEGVSVKNYFSEAYAKETGQAMEQKFAKDIGNSDIEFKPDHSFIINFSAPKSTEVMTMRGTWALAGDKLTSTLELAYNPAKMSTTSTVAITGNTMITTAVMAPPSRIIKSVSTSTRK